MGSINRGLTLAVAVAAVMGCASASAAPTLDHLHEQDAMLAPAIHVAVQSLSGNGDWVVIQDYGAGAGIHFDQKFTYRLAHPQALPSDGSPARLKIGVTVNSTATGAYQSPDGLKSYSCTATSTHRIRASATLRGKRLTVVPLRDLQPGDAKCDDPDGFGSWPTGAPWFAAHMVARHVLGHRDVGTAIALSFPQHTHNCTEPLMVGSCTEQLSWSSTVRLKARRAR